MKKKLLVVLVAAAIACAGAMLAGCGGQASNYDSQKVVWSDAEGIEYFQLVTTSDELVWDEEQQRDALCVYADVTNLKDEESNFKNVANIYANQGDKSLQMASITEPKDSAIPFTSSGFDFAAKETKKVVFAYYLHNDSDVSLNLNSYTSAVLTNDEDVVQISYPVADRLSDGMKSVLEAQQAGTFSCTYFDVKVLDGFLIQTSGTDSVSLKNEETKAFMDLDVSSETAKDRAERVAKSFKQKVKTTTIGKTEWKTITLNDTHFYLCADVADGKSLLVHVMASHKDADDQIKEIVIK